ILTRNPKNASNGVTYVEWLSKGASPEKHIGHIDAVINLAGVSINDGRWSDKHQQLIYTSRMQATEELLRIVAALPQKPSVWINASAIGVYPVSLDVEYTEESPASVNDFMGKTVY